jgi:hypothetical protein
VHRNPLSRANTVLLQRRVFVRPGKQPLPSAAIASSIANTSCVCPTYIGKTKPDATQQAHAQGCTKECLVACRTSVLSNRFGLVWFGP